VTATPRLLPGRASAEEVGGVLCEAIADYPVMRYVLGDQGDYAARLRALIGFFHGARVLRDDAIFGVLEDGELAGVALCSLPDRVAPPALEQLRERTWAELGPDARARYDSCMRAWEPVGVAKSNVHVNMLAVPPRYQGRGLARALLERVHAMSRERGDSWGVTLTTESERNVALYQHLGYEVVGQRPIAPGLETWGLWRPDHAGP
jgi:GNAT superfamily N-acetyltransferase